MRKKAVAESVTTVVLALVIFVILLVFSTAINTYLNEVHQRENCKLSIVAVELGKFITRGVASPKIDCPMQQVTIAKKDLPKGDSANFVKTKFAQEMWDTWYVAGRGENRKFQDAWQGGQVHCLLYARINFKDNIGLQKTDLGSMTQWLTTNNPRESSQSYFKYLTYKDQRAFHIVDASDPANIKDIEEIDPAKNYYVLYYAVMWDSGMVGRLNPLQQFAILKDLVGSGSIPQVFVVQEDQFANLGCDRLLN